MEIRSTHRSASTFWRAETRDASDGRDHGDDYFFNPQKVGRNDSRSGVEKEIINSTAWQKWFADNVPPDIDAVINVEDRPKPNYNRRGRTVTFYAPVSWFQHGKYRQGWHRTYRELWRKAATSFGWPEPPSLP